MTDGVAWPRWWILVGAFLLGTFAFVAGYYVAMLRVTVSMRRARRALHQADVATMPRRDRRARDRGRR